MKGSNEQTKDTTISMLRGNDLRFDARVLKEAKALVNSGYSVTVHGVAQEGVEYCNEEGPIRITRLRLVLKALPKWKLLWPIKYLELVLRMVASVVHARPDVIHAHDLDMLVPGYVAHLFLPNSKIVYDAAELWTERVGVPLRRMWRRIERFLIRRVDRVIAANEERAEVMFKEYGARALPTVIHNYPVVTELTGGNYLRRFVDERGHVGDRILLYQGHIMETRNLEQLVALTANVESGLVLVFLGYGTEEYIGRLRKLAEQLKCSDRVLFHPPVPPAQLVDFISSADMSAVIYPNTCRNNYLCAPNKLWESLMAGLFIVGSPLPPIRRVVDSYGVGITVDFSDPVSAAVAVKSWLDRPIELAAARKRARALALTVANWESEARSLVELYNGLVCEARKR